MSKPAFGDDPNFRPLGSSGRANTMTEGSKGYERLSFVGEEGVRARTSSVDSGKGGVMRESISRLSVEDVLYRKHFNPVEKRDRSLSGAVAPLSPAPTGKSATVVVDPFSTGLCVAADVRRRGHDVICCYSDTLESLQELIALIPNGVRVDYAATVFHDGGMEDQEEALDKTVNAIKGAGYEIEAVLAGAESGVGMTDRLADAFGVTGNGARGTEVRRNKYLMGEAVRNAGHRAVNQKLATKWSDIEEFLKEWNPDPFKVVVKPVDSAGSDDVFKCTSVEAVKNAFGEIMGKVNGLGLENTAVLVQEFLDGTEYAVDTVSRNGEHKVVAVWEYDKREVNGSAFVYFGAKLRPANDPNVRKIVDYQKKVLDAVGIKHGPGHGEVKIVRGEPCLVEVGARCHGGEGTFMPLADECVGYNQVTVGVDSYLNKEAFDKIPEAPWELKAYAAKIDLVSYEHGILEGYPGLEEIEKMPSFRTKQIHLQPGQTIKPTIDLFTTPGTIMVLHKEEKVLLDNFNRIHEMEVIGELYKSLPIEEEPEEVDHVVVVDPFSTGAMVARRVADRGYPVICMYSGSLEKMEALLGLVPDGVDLSFVGTVEYDGDPQSTARKLKAFGRIKAVLAGAETGVLTADIMSKQLGTRRNRMQHSEARRNKYLMGETVRAAGHRAVRQKKCTSWEDAEEFFKEYTPDPFKLVVKPPESAGSEGVIKCVSKEEVKKAFDSMLGKTNSLGIVNDFMLLQEYLEGTEYVIDAVTRDGEHKIIGIWEYDKREVNNAPFVYFGVYTRGSDDERIKSIISYQKKVLDALGIVNGPSHGEIKFDKDGPCLVEVGARCHGGEGTWMKVMDRCVGYNQVDVTIDSYLDKAAFDKIPSEPGKLKRYGVESFLVCYDSGTLVGFPGFAAVEKFSSFLEADMWIKPGSKIQPTIDIFTSPGLILLVNDSKEALDQDVEKLHELEKSGMYDIA